MKRVLPYLALVLLAITVLIADKYYPYGPSSDEEDVYLAQNLESRSTVPSSSIFY